MENSHLLYLSSDFPEVVPTKVKAGPNSVVVQTVDFKEKSGVLIAGTGEKVTQLDQELWDGPPGVEFRSLCDKYWTLKRAWENGCKEEPVRAALMACTERMDVLKGLLLVTSYEGVTASNLTPDIGIVVSVGKNHQDKYQVGDKVALRPGDLYLQEQGSVPYRVLKDQYDPHTGEFLYDVTDSVPLKLTEDGVETLGEWVLAKKVRKQFEIDVSGDHYEQFLDIGGVKTLFKVTDPANDLLTLTDPHTWGLPEGSCVVQRSCLTGVLALTVGEA